MQTSIHCTTFYVQWSVNLSGSSGSSSGFRGRNISLMRKGVIRVIPRRESQLGFYSQYFVIPKKGEGLLPILVLWVLNKHLRKYKFKMLSLRMLCQSIYQGDWFISMDLQDASMHNKVLCKCIIHSFIHIFT